MDEDFMADPDVLFYWKSELSAGYGALDDFAVIRCRCSGISSAMSRPSSRIWSKPYADRPLEGRRAPR